MKTKTQCNPTISVIMGTLYLKRDLNPLKKSVDSILNQSFQDFEFLICDDGSVAEAKTLLELYSEQDNRVRLIRPGNMIDLASKLNACFHSALGTYIARMDDDDYSLPERFNKQIHVLEKDPNIAFVGSNVKLIKSGHSFGNLVLPEKPQVKDFYIRQPYIHPSMIFRSNALTTVGGYSESCHQILCEDYDLLLRLYAAGYHGLNLQENLLEYSVPETGKGNRRIRHRWNETVTRFERYRDLGILHCAFPFVLKPLLAGFLPEPLLSTIRDSYYLSHTERK